MSPAPSDIQADAAWFWKREAWAAGRAAFERTFNKDERAARRFDFIARANKTCAETAEREADKITANGFVVLCEGVSARLAAVPMAGE